MLCAQAALAANPFLSAPSDAPIAARFTGNEWGDAIEGKEQPLGAQVVTTRLVQLPFGAVFRISFTEIVSRSKPPRQISAYDFLATDSEIVLLSGDDLEEAIVRLKLLTKPPVAAPEDIYGISSGTRTYPIGKLSSAKLTVTGDRCTYKWSHSSGHFVTMIWQRGVGLVELAKGRGARADGFVLVRATAPQGSAAPAQKVPSAK